MRDFFDLPYFYSALIITAYNAVAAADLYCVIVCSVYKIKKRNAFFSFVLFAASTFSLFLLLGGHIGGCFETFALPIYNFVKSLSTAAVVSALAVQAVLACLSFCLTRSRRKRNITPMSIKEGVDKLPTGLCCYNEKGTPKLVNNQMDSFSRIITGEPLFDAKEFWSRITNGDLVGGSFAVTKGETPIIRLPDGEVRSFSRSEMTIGGKKMFEITAANITEQYALSCQIQEYNDGLAQVNNRLEYYGETIADITREREILAAKVSIHDKLGKALLASKRYIEKGESAVDTKVLLDIWRRSVSHLRNESAHEADENSLDELYDAAALMGITLTVRGELPEDDSRIMRFIMSGARECLTNAVHHAKASNLEITVNDSGEFAVIEYTNDGLPPVDKVTEGGGLSYLRRKVENAGGVMQILSAPRFILRLKIPKKEALFGD